jgi:hypothetical protein
MELIERVLGDGRKLACHLPEHTDGGHRVRLGAVCLGLGQDHVVVLGDVDQLSIAHGLFAPSVKRLVQYQAVDDGAAQDRIPQVSRKFGVQQ